MAPFSPAAEIAGKLSSTKFSCSLQILKHTLQYVDVKLINQILKFTAINNNRRNECNFSAAEISVISVPFRISISNHAKNSQRAAESLKRASLYPETSVGFLIAFIREIGVSLEILLVSSVISCSIIRTNA